MRSDAWDPLGRALEDYQAGETGAVLRVHSDLGPPETVPVALFFRRPGSDGPPSLPWDVEVLRRARGRVLDVGACAGAMTLALTEGGLRVTALEPLAAARRVLRARGVGDVRGHRLEELSGSRPWDTVLLLMNGTALAGTLAGLDRLLRVLRPLVAPGGQVLLDSTDLRSWPAETGGAGAPEREDGRYVGEVHYQLEYRGVKGAPFPQLFADADTLARAALRAGWRTEVLGSAPGGEYLARLVSAGTIYPGPSPVAS